MPTAKYYDGSEEKFKFLKDVKNKDQVKFLHGSGHVDLNISEFVNLKYFRWEYRGNFSTFDSFQNLKKLKYINVFCNKVESLEHLSGCINLKELYCSSNKITSLRGLENCVNLEILSCDRNQIVSLESLRNCTNLKELLCSSNQLTSLQGIENCISITHLHCDHNQLESLEPLCKFVNLREIVCGNNHINDVEPLKFCTSLSDLLCENNRIQSLSPLYQLRDISYIRWQGNPIEMNIQTERFLEKIQIRFDFGSLQVYSDGQNVHNSSIQKSVSDSINNLLKDEINIGLGTCLNEIEKCVSESQFDEINRWCSDNIIHSYLNIKYSDLILYVWNRIRSSEHKSDLIEILKSNINDSISYCFTGRLNKLLNTLCGFYDDVHIRISDREQANNVLYLLIKRYSDKDQIKKHLRNELEERSTEADIIEEYIKIVDDL